VGRQTGPAVKAATHSRGRADPRDGGPRPATVADFMLVHVVAVTFRPTTPRFDSATHSPFVRPAADLRSPSGRSVVSPEGTAIALAHKMFGAPTPMMLLRHGGTLRILGWTLGSGRAECQEDGRLVQFVGIDVVLIGDGRYAVSERTATDGGDEQPRLEARCSVFDAPGEVRRHCEESDSDASRTAARLAALDHATKRWPLFRSTERRWGDALPLPFALD
jgi:hypothetical protein